jgi:hypothetical protein
MPEERYLVRDRLQAEGLEEKIGSLDQRMTIDALIAESQRQIT